MKLGFADVERHLADPEFMSVGCTTLLDGDYLSSRAKLIDIRKAKFPATGIPQGRGTVYLTAADSDGLMVSLIQSNFWGFGSGIVIPGTGISMQNRGYGFTLERGHPNQVDGGKRPYHTIIPSFVTRDGLPVMSFGVMGGHMQPQGHVQIITRIFDYGQNPQAASDAPRWCLLEDMRVAVEPGFSPDVLDELSARGHEIVTDLPEQTFGGAQLIYRMDDHYVAASDHRKDGMTVGF
jgi:gamma-glutamyltranspeptidase/glutathione hydrolase